MTGLAIAAALFFAYTLLARWLDRWSVTAPFVLVLTGIAVGPAGLGLIQNAVDEQAGVTLAELTLAILLFTDAATVRLREAETDARVVGRLLAIGLPLTIVLGAVAGVVILPGLDWTIAAVLATILAPTDAALGLPLVSNPLIPARVRRVLNIESGLNDGIATPFLTFFLAVEVASETHHNWALESAVELGLAVVAAVVVGGLGGWLLREAQRSGLTSGVSVQLAIVALALLAYGGSIAIGGNGFVAAFGAGIAFRQASNGTFVEASRFAEDLGLFGSFIVWLLFGIALAGPIVTGGFHPQVILYAILSLTVVRMIPVAIALFRSGFHPETVALIGWFGPRGLASVVFTFLALDTLRSVGPVPDLLVQVATWTVFLSVIVHGLSAGPLARLYARRIAVWGGGRFESMEITEPRQRRRGIG